MRPLRALLTLAAALLCGAGTAHAQLVTSPGPDTVSVTIYRAPHRDADQELELDWLEGFALVTETRRVSIPAGRATIRFEGVAARILPESAILTGLPDGVREKNLDADLLSRASLYARNLNRPVTIRRRREGRTVEERAIIRSGPAGPAILETREGFIAAGCGPSRDSLVYDSVPADLSAKPTLSVETDAAQAQDVTLTLSYLAWGMDWQANYVATMRPDGRSADLFAWLTLANGDITGFENAETMVVAGKVESGEGPEGLNSGDADYFAMRCFAMRDVWVVQRRNTVTAQDIGALPAPAPAMMGVAEAEDIIVTGSRIAEQEDLGDLKLYRVPFRTTVAAMSQKQVALLDKPSVRVELLYRDKLTNGSNYGHTRLVLRAQNKPGEGLGVPLPAGPVTVFEPHSGRALLIGEGATEDKAVGEEVEFELDPATQVSAELAEGDSGSNANPFAIRYEVELRVTPNYALSKVSARLGRKNGMHLWRVEVPANTTRTLRYRLTDVPDPTGD
jgi:hypothetical protein